MAAAWFDGVISHNSYADVSTQAKFKEYMKSRKGWKAEEWAAENLEQNNITDVENNATGWEDFFIKEKGPWWPQYCELIEPEQ